MSSRSILPWVAWFLWVGSMAACSGSTDPLEDAATLPEGTLGGACFANQTCFTGLSCSNGVCVSSSPDSGLGTDAADASLDDLGASPDVEPGDSGPNLDDAQVLDAAPDGATSTDAEVDGGADSGADGGVDSGADGGADGGSGGAPPSQPEVLVRPEHPTTNDDLLCVVDTPSVDPEGQPGVDPILSRSEAFGRSVA